MVDPFNDSKVRRSQMRYRRGGNLPRMRARLSLSLFLPYDRQGGFGRHFRLPFGADFLAKAS